MYVTFQNMKTYGFLVKQHLKYILFKIGDTKSKCKIIINVLLLIVLM